MRGVSPENRVSRNGFQRVWKVVTIGFASLVGLGSVAIFQNSDYLLHRATVNGIEIAIPPLLLVGADANANQGRSLIKASYDGNIGIVTRLLAAGADIHVSEDLPLRFAAKEGHIEVVKLLLEHGANVHAKENGAIGWATWRNHTDVVELLKKHMNPKVSIQQRLQS